MNSWSLLNSNRSRCMTDLQKRFRSFKRDKSFVYSTMANLSEQLCKIMPSHHGLTLSSWKIAQHFGEIVAISVDSRRSPTITPHPLDESDTQTCVHPNTSDSSSLLPTRSWLLAASAAWGDYGSPQQMLPVLLQAIHYVKEFLACEAVSPVIM